MSSPSPPAVHAQSPVQATTKPPRVATKIAVAHGDKGVSTAAVAAAGLPALSPVSASSPRVSSPIGLVSPVAAAVPVAAAAAAASAPVPNSAAPVPSNVHEDMDVDDEGEEEEEDEEDDGEGEDEDTDDEEMVAAPAPPTPEEVAAVAARDALAAKDRGNDLYKRGEFQEAVAAYSDAVRLMPAEAMYYANRAAAFLMLDRFKDVLEDCARTLAIEPMHVKAHLRAGKAHFKMGNFEEAERSYGLALVTEPRNVEAAKEKKAIAEIRTLITRADEAMRAGNTRLANVCYDAALAQAPDSDHLQLAKIDILLLAKKLDDALAITTRMLKSKSNSTLMLQRRAKIFYLQGDVEKSKKTLIAALNLDPDHVQCQKDLRLVKKLQGLHTLGNEAFESARWPAAVDAYTQALALDPSNATYNARLYGNRAAAYIKLSNYGAAISDCNSTLAIEEENVKAIARRAQCYVALGGVDNLEQGVRDYETAKRLVADPATLRKFSQELSAAQAALKQAKRKDYYKILDLPRDADEKAVKRAYHKMAKLWHPDRHSSSEEAVKVEAERVFKNVNEAYEVLSDPAKRRRYDAGADLAEIDQEEAHGGHGHGHGGFHGGGMPDIFQMFGGMGGMGGMRYARG